MTTYTSLGAHHLRVRKISFNPMVRGNEHAKGKSPLKIFNRIGYRGLRHMREKRYQRKTDRSENVAFKERDKRKHLSIEVDELNSKSPTEKLLKTLSPTAYVALMILHEEARKCIKTSYRYLEIRFGERKARVAREELEKLGLAHFDEQYNHFYRREPQIICCISDDIRPELEASI